MKSVAEKSFDTYIIIIFLGRNGMRHIPQPKEIYKHFKGNNYEIITLAKHSETEEMLVIYQALYGDFSVYARPLSSFLEPVDKVKYPNATQEFRFELCSEEVTNRYGQNDASNKQNQGDLVNNAAVTQETEKSDASGSSEAAESEDDYVVDERLMKFLDAESYADKLEVLYRLRNELTDELVTAMGFSMDLEIESGSVEEKYEALKNCLLTRDKFEGERLRR